MQNIKTVFILSLVLTANVFGMEESGLKQRLPAGHEVRIQIEPKTLGDSSILEEKYDEYSLFCRRDLNITENVCHFFGCASFMTYAYMIANNFWFTE